MAEVEKLPSGKKSNRIEVASVSESPGFVLDWILVTATGSYTFNTYNPVITNTLGQTAAGGLTDSSIDFGDLLFAKGRSFAWDGSANTDTNVPAQIDFTSGNSDGPVGKTWQSGTPNILTESVPWANVAPKLTQLTVTTGVTPLAQACRTWSKVVNGFMENVCGVALGWCVMIVSHSTASLVTVILTFASRRSEWNADG